MDDARPPRAGNRRTARSSARAVLAVVALAAAGAVACGAPPPAAPPPPAASSSEVTSAPIPSPADVPYIPPDQKDAKFAEALASRNLQTGSPEDRSQVADRVCRAVEADTPLDDLVSQLQAELGGPTRQNTGFVIGAATAIYCPNELPKLKAPGGN